MQQSCMELFIGQPSLWLLTIFSYTISSVSPQDPYWIWQVCATFLYKRPEIKYTFVWMWGPSLLSSYRKLVRIILVGWISKVMIIEVSWQRPAITPLLPYTPCAQARPLYTLCTLQARQLYTLYTRNTPGKWQRATQQAQKGPKKPLNPEPKKSHLIGSQSGNSSRSARTDFSFPASAMIQIQVWLRCLRITLADSTKAPHLLWPNAPTQ